MTKKLIFPVDSSRAGGRRPANQHRSTAGSRDGIPGSQPPRRGGKANQNVIRPSENTNTNTTAQNGPTSLPPPDITTQDDQPTAPTIPTIFTIPTFNVEEITKLLEAGMDPNAEVYKLPKSPTKATAGSAPASPWAPKPGQMANGKDFWMELRKQMTEKMAERDREEALAKEQQAKEESGDTAKGG